MYLKYLLPLCSLLTVLQPAAAQQKTFTVSAGQLGAEIQPTMYGVFFEDINMGADGGLYAELVKNRSFEFNSPLMGWTLNGRKEEGDILVVHSTTYNKANPNYLQVKVNNRGKREFGLTNEGFRGMGIRQGTEYYLSAMFRTAAPGITVHAELLTPSGKVIGESAFEAAPTGGKWAKKEITLRATADEPAAKLTLWLEGNGMIDLDIISLFPSNTWKNRRNGLRADMVQMLADMKPGFIRFPGGCIVEGRDLANRFQWKKTIGPIENRELIINRWNTEFSHRLTPDYFQSFGLGFFEYFQLAEDIGAAPLPILNCGMACQFNTAELAPMEELQPYIQDAIDLVEFANGPATSEWGKVRAAMGHPEPFNLTMIGVGNENWGPQYIERASEFARQLKAAHPEIKLVFSSGTDPNGDRFNFLNDTLRKMKADFIDEHYYRNPEWFLSNARRYDNYPRTGSKVFAGEYAAHETKDFVGADRNTLRAAIAEAAFLTGLERNADVVQMASYAPLFANAEQWQWAPDLIWVNSMKVVPTPSYHVQKLYSLNKGTNVLPLVSGNEAVSGQDSLYASAVFDKKTNDIIVKIVNAGQQPASPKIQFQGRKSLAKKATLTTLTGDNPVGSNKFDAQPVQPVVAAINVSGNVVPLTVAPNSFTVLRIGAGK
ncbi:Alpha-L-arabinofuranosidase [Chitinophaga terrae (ex Kim and Jung 2007)]|uniref:non-reducing end alpha-L-arabinofuranosidase n=1 Tax=Chitinophaga terrae (ex Kim and Jung 2007) TaxID=408074 RepID=A0A1H3YWL8_9BACT|nr:alpha-L-arabinofuranosidase C-terminal domain-containing protein [Chitinophaga terrae (ex Kim and Jung 2007)]GEP88527.1 alpha-L-arabinofuranosidase [Chitinophaga terrae (ex Kim and Jung 2007)]SEA15488.1 Alpha-L-arabinofuranosidase [Chitinophaga terrae (ex Kim and Jung 2007)]